MSTLLYIMYRDRLKRLLSKYETERVKVKVTYIEMIVKPPQNRLLTKTLALEWLTEEDLAGAQYSRKGNCRDVTIEHISPDIYHWGRDVRDPAHNICFVIRPIFDGRAGVVNGDDDEWVAALDNWCATYWDDSGKPLPVVKDPID